MSQPPKSSLITDLTAGAVVFVVALPLCLGIATASGAEPFAGVLAGIVGGIIVGILSGSHTSVSGPAAGLTAILIVQIPKLGFEPFLLAVLLAGLIQVAWDSPAPASSPPSSLLRSLKGCWRRSGLS